MDMPISQVNIRLFAQLPPDPGLGLLFATGTVSQIVYASGGKPIQFTLRHAGYALRCKVAPSVIHTFDLVEGQQVRSTGHLSFSSQSVQFHLLVRDLELVSDTAIPWTEAVPLRPPPSTELLEPMERSVIPDWLTAIQRRAQVVPARLAPTEVPEWVHALAPPEAPHLTDRGADVRWGKQRAEFVGKRALVPPPADTEVVKLPRLEDDEQLLFHLLEALERSEQEDVELTAETLAQFSGHLKAQPVDSVEPAAPPAPPELAAPPDLPAPVKLRERPLWIAALFLVGAILVLLFLLMQLGIL